MSHQTPHLLTLDLNEPTNKDFGDWKGHIQSYTQLLSGLYDDHQNQQIPQEPPQENRVVGFPNEILDPFNEDEDDILTTIDDYEGEEPYTHHTNIQPYQHNSSYVSPEHFLHFPIEPSLYDPEFGRVFDCDTVVYISETLFLGAAI